MDVEGAEWSVLAQLLASRPEIQPHSISLELHTSVYGGSRAAGWGDRKSHGQLAALGRQLAAAGYGLPLWSWDGSARRA